jgi:hypothetical protein
MESAIREKYLCNFCEQRFEITVLCHTYAELLFLLPTQELCTTEEL